MGVFQSPTFPSEREEGAVYWGEQAGQLLNPGWAAGGAAASYWRAVLEETPQAFAPNLDTRAGVVAVGGKVWPVTLGEGPGVNSYPCSLRTQYVRYPLCELGMVPGMLTRVAVRAGLAGVDVLLGLARVERVVQWNSLLLSTNLHPECLADAVPEVTRTLASLFPGHAVLVKNIHGREDSSLPEVFRRAGYDLVCSRQVYFFDGRTRAFQQRSAVRRDEKELASLKRYRVVHHSELEPDDLSRIADLYHQLYVQKHSRLNPQYTERFVKRAVKERWLDFTGLRGLSGRLDGVFGCFQQGSTTSTPFIGYDTRLPAELGLYRMLVALLLRRVAKERLLLNYSSGAGDFKRRRGGEPVLEWNALYTQHLHPSRRAGFVGLRELANRVGRPFLESRKI
jgi:hypothetical protein